MLENKDKPVRRVYHRDLERTGESPYRSQCPACKRGILMVNRQETTLGLRREDWCTVCGQQYHYLDTVIAQEMLPTPAVGRSLDK